METRASLNCIIKTLHFIFFILNKKSLKIEQKLYHVPKHYSSVSKGKMTEFKSHKKLEVREIKKNITLKPTLTQCPSHSQRVLIKESTFYLTKSQFNP